MKPVYEIEGLTFSYGASAVLDGLSLTFHSGEMTAVVGPNGAGKSTLMSVMAGLRDDYSGACRFEGVELRAMRKRDLARRAGFIPQQLRIDFPFTAEQVVFMGRTPHCKGLFESPEDRRAVAHALVLTDAAPFAKRSFRELSGGEKQRVVLASALAQEPAALLLDEPTTFLDLKHQIAIYALLQKLAREGHAVIAVTHDLNLASAYADRIVVLREGAVAADGPPDRVISVESDSPSFRDAGRRSGGCGRAPLADLRLERCCRGRIFGKSLRPRRPSFCSPWSRCR